MPTVVEVHIIRHAQSIANAGEATTDPHSIPLSALGREQAESLANSRLIESLIQRVRDGAIDLRLISSRMMRTQQTIHPAAMRIGHECNGGSPWPVDRWPVDEFTFLSFARLNRELGKATTIIDRRRLGTPYWERCDPHHCDGDDAESFAMFRNRVREMLARFREVGQQARRQNPGKRLVLVVVAHNRTMLMTQQECVWPMLDDEASMLAFRSLILSPVDVPNVATLPLRVHEESVWVGPVRWE